MERKQAIALTRRALRTIEASRFKAVKMIQEAHEQVKNGELHNLGYLGIDLMSETHRTPKGAASSIKALEALRKDLTDKADIREVDDIIEGIRHKAEERGVTAAARSKS